MQWILVELYMPYNLYMPYIYERDVTHENTGSPGHSEEHLKSVRKHQYYYPSSRQVPVHRTHCNCRTVLAADE